MKRFARFVSSLPFSGKIAVRPALYNVYLSTTTWERRKHFGYAVGFLIAMALIHAFIASMAASFTMQAVAPVFVKAYTALFALINASVALTQTYLTWRVVRFYFSRKPFPRSYRMAPDYDDEECRFMVFVTLTGGLLFILVTILFS